MNQTQTNPAEQYARLISREVVALDTILQGRPYGYYPDRPDYDDEEHTDYRNAVRELEMEHVTNPDEIPQIWLTESALDVAILRNENDYGHARVEILRTCGGPRCEIIRDTNNGTCVTVEVWDGSDHYAHTMNPDHVAAWLDQVAGV